MLKLIALVFTLSFSAIAGVQSVSIHNLSEKSGIALLKHHFEEARYVQAAKSFAFEGASSYANGDFVILWGVGASDKDQTITADEYKGLWRVMNYLSKKDFRVIMNVVATGEDLKEAFASSTSSVVLFSSHGNNKYFYDFNHQPVATDVFESRAANVYQFILSACNGAVALRTNYVVPEDLKVFAWEGLTNSTELLNFLVGDTWTGFEGKK